MSRSARILHDDGALLASGALGFERFYVRYERLVLGYFLRRTRRSDLAADLTAETFARALAGRARFDPAAGPARAWLFGIAHHLLVDSIRCGQVEDAVRRRLRMEPVTLDDAALARIDSVAEDSALQALSDLPEAQREALRGRVIDELDYAELAAGLHCSESVVRQRVSRGLTSLRGRLEEQR